jgi:hypothetical protein
LQGKLGSIEIGSVVGEQADVDEVPQTASLRAC